MFVTKPSTSYNRAARPNRAAPATPVKPVGRAAAALPLPEAAAEDALEATELVALEAPLVAEAMTEEAEEATEPALLVALLRAPPASLVMLPRIELAAEVKEAREDAAPDWPFAAAELRLERLAEKADSAELKLFATDP